ncbi:LysR substrate-binding domain-containing protein [Desulfovibrio inopinatus]|uniref:LysR substrate-binding domain-containing protein n=1 Tax=Desulfovibrio inopinatus TaxID=102109 RepID=UPI0003F8E523|nr:LysR substrate-binding domain-containing protein [Desulfovibrio inopinatus]
MHLPIESLRTFAAIVDAGGFTRAAVTVNRTQSAVSMQIKRLEEEIGHALFVRDGKSVTLSAEGELLLGYARRLVRLHDEAGEAIARPRLDGLVRLGAPEEFVARILPKVLSRFSAYHPGVRVDVFSQASKELLARLEAGDLDVAVCTLDEPGAVRTALPTEIIRLEPVVWVTSAVHDVHEHDPLPLALFHEGCAFRRWAEQTLARAGRDYRIAYVSASIGSLIAAVSAGLAVAPFGLSHIPEGLRILGEADGFPGLPVAAVTLHKVRGPRSEAVDALAQTVARAFAEKRDGFPSCAA